MAKPRPERNSPERRVLPMELRTGDRITDETGEWEIIARPYTTAGLRRVRVGAVGRIPYPTRTRMTHPQAWLVQDAAKQVL
jgi:hypothetical protein